MYARSYPPSPPPSNRRRNKFDRYLPAISDATLGRWCLLFFLAPLIAINLSLFISIQAGIFEPCFPYWDGAVSVSRAGREVPARYFFKGIIIPCALLGILYWPLAATRLAAWHNQPSLSRLDKMMVICGLVGMSFLIVYAFALGHPGTLYRFMRRVGIYLFFTGLTVAEILFTLRLWSLALTYPTLQLITLVRIKLALLATMLTLALCVLPLLYWLTGSRSIAERTVEWNYLLPMHIFFLASYYAWRKMANSNLYRKF